MMNNIFKILTIGITIYPFMVLAETGTCGLTSTATCVWETIELSNGEKQLVISREGSGTVSVNPGWSTLPWGSGISEIVIKEGISSIGQGAFNVQRGVQSVDMSEAKDLTTIERAAFANIPSLKTVIMPENLTSVYYYPNDGNNLFIRSGVEKIYCIASQMGENGACSRLATNYNVQKYERDGDYYIVYDSEDNISAIFDSSSDFQHNKVLEGTYTKKDEDGNPIAQYDGRGNIFASYAYNNDGSVSIRDGNGKLIGLQGKRIFTIDEATALVSGNGRNSNTFIIRYR